MTTKRNAMWAAMGLTCALVVATAIAVHTPSAVRETSTPTRPAGAEPTVHDTPRGSGGPSRPRTTKLAQLGSTVTSLASVPGGSEMLVGERTGQVWAFRAQEFGRFRVPVLSERPVLDLSKEVSQRGEQGLFGLAIVAKGSRVVVTFSGLDGALYVDSFAYAPGTDIAVDTRVQLFRLASPLPFHYGGGMAVDDDGDLYVGIGDLGLGAALPVLPGPQDPALINGGVLRIPADVVAASTSSWVASPTDQVARGLRNPWRISIDPPTGDLWIGNVGNETIETIDRVPKVNDVRSRPMNFGWPYFEGSVRHYETLPAGYQPDAAVLERRQKGNVCGMVGGEVYRGALIPELSGRYLYGDLCNVHVRSFALGRSGRATGDSFVFDVPQNIVSFGVGPSGELYALGAVGGVYRVDPGWWQVRDLDQARETTSAEETASGPMIDCKVIEALKPLTYLGSLSRDQLQSAVEHLVVIADEVAPTLPPDLAAAALTVRRAFARLEVELAAVNFDMSSPVLGEIRQQMVEQSGAFAGFGDALGTLYASRCK